MSKTEQAINNLADTAIRTSGIGAVVKEAKAQTKQQELQTEYQEAVKKEAEKQTAMAEEQYRNDIIKQYEDAFTKYNDVLGRTITNQKEALDKKTNSLSKRYNKAENIAPNEFELAHTDIDNLFRNTKSLNYQQGVRSKLNKDSSTKDYEDALKTLRNDVREYNRYNEQVRTYEMVNDVLEKSRGYRGLINELKERHNDVQGMTSAQREEYNRQRDAFQDSYAETNYQESLETFDADYSATTEAIANMLGNNWLEAKIATIDDLKDADTKRAKTTNGIQRSKMSTADRADLAKKVNAVSPKMQQILNKKGGKK